MEKKKNIPRPIFLLYAFKVPDDFGYQTLNSSRFLVGFLSPWLTLNKGWDKNGQTYSN